MTRPSLIVLVALWLAAPPAAADENAPAPVPENADATGPPQGWMPKLVLGINGALMDSQGVVGSADGTTVQLGALLDAGLLWVDSPFEWQSQLKINESFTKTPTLNSVIKSADELSHTTQLVYRVFDWFGPFAQAGLRMPLTHGYEVRATPVIVIRPEVGVQEKPADTKIGLTHPFEPLLIDEALGGLVTPVQETAAKVDIKLGFGGQHVVVGNRAYAIVDDAATPELELQKLESSDQGGVLLQAAVGGAPVEMVTYEVGAKLFQPLFGTGLETLGFEDMSITVDAKLSAKPFAWLSFDYVFSAKRIPTIVEAWQVQNQLLLSLNYDFATLFMPPPPAPAPPCP